MQANIESNIVSFSLMLMASIGAATGQQVVEAELHEHVTNAFINPEKDSSLPKALIIGDSISIGYTVQVRNNLQGIAEVFRPPVNCQHTGYGLAQIKNWLGTNKWDVIHFNFGIWDTHLLNSKGDLLSDSMAGDTRSIADGIRIRHTPEQYKENLTKLIEILKDTGAKLIWASSTPIMYRTGERFEAIPTLNRTATDLMKSHGITIDDLYEFVLPHVKEWQNPDQCHFNAEGNKQLGKQVAACIRRAIDSKDQQTNRNDQSQ